MAEFSAQVFWLCRYLTRYLCCILPNRNEKQKSERQPEKSEKIESVPVMVYDKPFTPVLSNDADASSDSYDNAESIAYTYCMGKDVGRRHSVSSQGSTGSRKLSSSRRLSYYTIQGEQCPQILLAVFVSRAKQYVAGNVFEIDAIPGVEIGGPKRVKVHVRILPSKRSVLETDWTDAISGKAFFMEAFKKSLDENENKEDNYLRFRVYGNKKCVGECYVDLKEIWEEKGAQRFWMTLVKNNEEATLIAAATLDTTFEEHSIEECEP